jgi:hypothetical protein
MQNKFNLDAKSKWSQCKINLISVQNKCNLNAKSEWSQCKKIIAAVQSQRGRVSCSNSKNKMQSETFYTEILENLEQCFALFVVNLCRLDSNFVRFVDARVRRVMS